MNNTKKELIALEVIKTLYNRFQSFPDEDTLNRNAPFHEAFFKAFTDKIGDKITDIPFFLSMASWFHGLNTTLGQSFFERVAHILSDGEKRAFTSKRRNQLAISQKQILEIASIIQELKTSSSEPNLEEENRRIYNNNVPLTTKIDLTLDCFIESDDKISAVELKSVRPNAGEMRGEKQKLLEGKAALKNANPEKEIEFYIGFPFDPTSDKPTGSNKDIFLASLIDTSKYLATDEVLLGPELWDFLSGEENTMETLLEIINAIADKDFINNYNFISDHSNCISNKEIYIKKLKSWFLYSEIFIAENYTDLRKKSKSGKWNKIFNQKVFLETGCYNLRRSNFLTVIIDSKEKDLFDFLS